jgi:hypothetical protein
MLHDIPDAPQEQSEGDSVIGSLLICGAVANVASRKAP